MSEKSNSKAKTSASKPKKKAFQVAPSPLNAVKLDLGLFILVGLVLFLVLELMSITQGLRFTLLGLWAMSTVTWVVFKTQAIIKKSALQANDLDKNNQESDKSRQGDQADGA